MPSYVSILDALKTVLDKYDNGAEESLHEYIDGPVREIVEAAEAEESE